MGRLCGEPCLLNSLTHASWPAFLDYAPSFGIVVYVTMWKLCPHQGSGLHYSFSYYALLLTIITTLFLVFVVVDFFGESLSIWLLGRGHGICRVLSLVFRYRIPMLGIDPTRYFMGVLSLVLPPVLVVGVWNIFYLWVGQLFTSFIARTGDFCKPAFLWVLFGRECMPKIFKSLCDVLWCSLTLGFYKMNPLLHILSVGASSGSARMMCGWSLLGYIFCSFWGFFEAFVNPISCYQSYVTGIILEHLLYVCLCKHVFN